MPSAQAVALAARHAGKAALMREHGQWVGRAVKAFGFNTTLAPVLDLALPASAAVMGTRAVDANSAGVVEYGRNFLAGLAAQEIVGCGKHFPGLGGGALDSHLDTPSIERSMRQLTQQDLVPYRELSRELPMVMISHAAFPRTPGRDRPASVSAFWITNVLRKKLAYRGLIFSDDLEMGGILKSVSLEEAVLEAVRAGMDLMEICHSAELILRAYESLLSEAERSARFRALVLTRARQSALKRKRLFPLKPSVAPSQRNLEALRSHILRFGETISMYQGEPT